MKDNIEVLKEDCFDFNGKYFFYSFYGDENRTLAHVDSSKLFREELYFMKRRLDTDITPENEDANLKDFSRDEFRNSAKKTKSLEKNNKNKA